MFPGYSLDTVKKVKVQKVEFLDSFEKFEVDLEVMGRYSAEVKLGVIRDVLLSLDSVGSKGYLTTQDLTKIPVISDILPSFFDDEEEDSVYVRGDKAFEGYKWLYNLLIINLYLFSLDCVKTPEIVRDDYLTEFRYYEQELYSRLDTSIRYHIQKRGLSIKENVYVGFDTEYTQITPTTNRLVSSQLAVSCKILLHVPKQRGYELSHLVETTRRLVEVKLSKKFKKVEFSVKSCIEKIRNLKHGLYDESVKILTEGLKVIRGLSYYEGDESLVFSFPSTAVQPYIKIGNSFSFDELLKVSGEISHPLCEVLGSKVLEVLKEIVSQKFSLVQGHDHMVGEMYKKYESYKVMQEMEGDVAKVLDFLTPEQLEGKNQNEKSVKRITKNLPEKMSITITKNYYVIGHLTPADLGQLSDFEQIKEELAIVNGSFISLGKPLSIQGKKVHVRDTMLLAPGGSKALATIGGMYPNFPKLKINRADLINMQGFLERDKESFVEYALRDAVISLVHAMWMDDFNTRVGGNGVPVSLSGIGRRYVKSIWSETKYPGYQISQKYLIGDVSKTMTPKGLHALNEIGFVLPYYIANYKGGRNECFMFGLDRETKWYDYDLVSAYTTVMSMAGHPDYEKVHRLTQSDLIKMTQSEMLYSYLILHADFEFPSTVKYPSIPCYVDETCTVYPQSGSCVITGAEYILALGQGCKFDFKDIYNIPFQISESESKDLRPFSTVIKDVQAKRREYEKGTISNLMYKEIGNSIYGSVVRGIGDKRKFDVKSKGTVRMYGDELTNPLIASWTTAFVRSVMGECLQEVQGLSGKVVSVTTDGFITNIENLESKLSGFLIKSYQQIRKELSGDETSLELKCEGVGVLAWSTRGQMGLGSSILATTGFQNRAYQNKKELKGLLEEVFKTETKELEYVQTTLRSAKDIYTRGGNVTMKYRDQIFRMHYDNRRVLASESSIPPTIEKLVDSVPVPEISVGKNLRYLGSILKKKQYSRFISSKGVKNVYEKSSEVPLRNFIKGLLSSPPLFNLPTNAFESYVSVLDFIKRYDPSIKMSEDRLVKYKLRKVKLGKIQRTKECEDFVKYVKQRFPLFDESGFYLSPVKLS